MEFVVQRRVTHVQQLSLAVAGCKERNYNEDDVEPPFAGSEHPRSSAPIRRRIYRCLVL